MSEILKELKTLNEYHFVSLTIFLAAILSPGLLIIFHFKNELFFDLDTIKLLILAISISLPILFSGVLVVLFCTSEDFSSISSISSFVTLMSFYGTFTVSYFFEWTFKEFIGAYCIFMVGLTLITIVESWVMKKKSGKVTSV